MTINYTNKEKAIINKAWNALSYRAEITSNGHDLERALKTDKKDSKNTYSSKCLIFVEAINFYTNPNQSVFDMAHIREGVLLGGLKGADSIFRTEQYTGWVSIPLADLIALADDIKKIQSDSTARMIAEFDIKYKAIDAANNQ